jgi:hypothetical protein
MRLLCVDRYPISRSIVLLHRTLRREPALTQFETAQIANLCPATAEEAKSIIPRYVLLSLVTTVQFPITF